MGKKIVLLGTAPSSMRLAPFGSPEWEIWGCSPGTYPLAVQSGVRFDRFFELHRWEPGQTWFSEGYVDFLQTVDCPVIMSAPVPSIPNCQLLDWEYLVDKYGPYFFTSSLAWMCAMAIEENPDTIAFYGVDMASTTEYHDQRMGCQYFAMLAASKGIEVGVPPESDLFRPAPLYGVCEQSHGWIKQRIRSIELNDRLKKAQEQYNKATEEVHFLRGALDDQDWQLHSWFGAHDMLSSRHITPMVPGHFKIGEIEFEEPVPPKPKHGGVRGSPGLGPGL